MTNDKKIFISENSINEISTNIETNVNKDIDENKLKTDFNEFNYGTIQNNIQIILNKSYKNISEKKKELISINPKSVSQNPLNAKNSNIKEEEKILENTNNILNGFKIKNISDVNPLQKTNPFSNSNIIIKSKKYKESNEEFSLTKNYDIFNNLNKTENLIELNKNQNLNLNTNDNKYNEFSFKNVFLNSQKDNIEKTVTCRICLESENIVQIKNVNQKNDNKNNQNEEIENQIIDNNNIVYNNFISPCICHGTMKYVHESCLKKWIPNHVKKTKKAECEICKTNYKIKFETKSIYNKKKMCNFIEKILTFIGIIFLLIFIFDFIIYSIVVSIIKFNNEEKDRFTLILSLTSIGVILIVISFILRNYKIHVYEIIPINWRILNFDSNLEYEKNVTYEIFKKLKNTELDNTQNRSNINRENQINQTDGIDNEINLNINLNQNENDLINNNTNLIVNDNQNFYIHNINNENNIINLIDENILNNKTYQNNNYLKENIVINCIKDKINLSNNNDAYLISNKDDYLPLENNNYKIYLINENAKSDNTKKNPLKYDIDELKIEDGNNTFSLNNINKNK